MYNELIDAFLNIPQTRKSSSQTLATKYTVPLIDVQYMRTLDAESLNIFKAEFNHATISLETKKQAIKTQESNDFLGDLLEQRGIDRDQVVAKSFWAKDAKSKTSTFYSIRCDVPEESNTLDISGIKDILAETVEPYTWVEPTKINRTLMLYYSDLHIGMMIPKESTSGQSYTAEIFEERMMKTLELVKDVEEVQVCLLGDIIDGWDNSTTRTKHKQLPQNLNNREQFTVFISVMKKLFTALVDKNVKVKFVSTCNSNHDGDLAGIYAEALESWLNVKFPQIETNVFTKFIEHIKVQDKTFILTHGKDKEDQKFGLKLHADPKLENYFVRYMLDNGITPGSNVNVVKGDLHQSAKQLTEFFSMRTVLALCPPSKWITTNFQSSCAGGLSFDIVEGDLIYSSDLLF